MTANLASSAPAPVLKSGIDITRSFLSAIAMWNDRKMKNPRTVRALEPDTLPAPAAARQDCEPVCRARLHAIEIIGEAFPCDGNPGMALETLLDHVRSRR
jgi:hypothetical protein